MRMSHLGREENRNGGSGSFMQCPYCLGVSRFFISSTDRNRGTTDAVFDYYQCNDCGLIFMGTIPDDLVPFYKGGYQSIPRSLAELRNLAENERYRLVPILKHKKSGRLLEIGPWIGIFSCNAKDAGFDVTAIEMDRTCVDFLNDEVGIKTLQSSDPSSSLRDLDEKFDVIALWHCLEHLRNPWVMIEQAAKHLVPGGILVLALPNIESFQYSVLRSAWKHLDAPRHLFFYPTESLINLCERNGLFAREITTADELSDALSKDTWHSFATSIVRVRYARGILALVLRLASRKYERKKNAGAGLTAVFQFSTEGQHL
jgi:2-polyprenyl-3-methyl-5-hydroxy-6-metoxy-1,4-benzoquinol methylase